MNGAWHGIENRSVPERAAERTKLSSVADKAARSMMKPVMYLFQRCQATECPEGTYPKQAARNSKQQRQLQVSDWISSEFLFLSVSRHEVCLRVDVAPSLSGPRLALGSCPWSVLLVLFWQKGMIFRQRRQHFCGSAAPQPGAGGAFYSVSRYFARTLDTQNRHHSVCISVGTDRLPQPTPKVLLLSKAARGAAARRAAEARERVNRR